jgi:hypothetical protein
MQKQEAILNRLLELEKQLKEMRHFNEPGTDTTRPDRTQFQQWAISVTNLLEGVFGKESPHARNFVAMYSRDSLNPWAQQVERLAGIFLAAKSDFEGGYIFALKTQLSGEILGDFVLLAKRSLEEGHKDVAAVLACAALEDALKAYALTNSLEVGDKSMQEVVNALKGKGLVGGAQKALVDVMPKIRDYAMHANWEKIRAEDVSSVIGFVEQFLLSKFA